MLTPSGSEGERLAVLAAALLWVYAPVDGVVEVRVVSAESNGLTVEIVLAVGASWP